MKPLEQSRIDSFHQLHLNVLRLQGKYCMQLPGAVRD
jgi:hypothetical protein